MGHYRSEMINQEEEDRKKERERQRRETRAARIREAIRVEGIEYVLADILDNPTVARIQYNAD